MTAIVTSLLGGGWELVAGWILPTALNSLFFAVLVLPALRATHAFHSALTASAPVQAVALLVTAVVGGLVLSAFQTPLYRILEGYSWPARLRKRGTDRHEKARCLLEKRIKLARLSRRSEHDKLSDADEAELSTLRADPFLQGVPELSGDTSELDISLLAERLRRYPIGKEQILPTRFGNAIRRFEEYGYDRYRLDIITMWYALVGVVPDQVRKQVDASRASVDFFVCLIYGHVVVIISAVVALIADPGRFGGPVAAIVAATGLTVLWYLLAVRAIDEWAAAVSGLVDVGRKPLAESLDLDMPDTLEAERRMWELVSRQSRRAHSSHDTQLDAFRSPAESSQSATPTGTSGPA